MRILEEGSDWSNVELLRSDRVVKTTNGLLC